MLYILYLASEVDVQLHPCTVVKKCLKLMPRLDCVKYTQIVLVTRRLSSAQTSSRPPW